MTHHRSIKVFAACALGLGLAATACNQGQQSATPVVENPSVAGAYAELVNAVATCAQQVESCVMSAQGDTTALQTCRDDFASCRDSAGQTAVNTMAGAIRGCTDTNRQCESANHGQSGSQACEAALLQCIEANRPEPPDAAANGHAAGGRAADGHDAGAPKGAGSPVGDCIDALRSCVTGGGQPQSCAMDVRACVLAAVPTPDQVVPGAGAQNGTHGPSGASDAGHSGGAPDPHAGDAGHSSGTPDAHAADAGRPSGLPPQLPPQAMSGMTPPADAGAAASASAMACLDAFRTCTMSGGQPRTCVQDLSQCMQGMRP